LKRRGLEPIDRRRLVAERANVRRVLAGEHFDVAMRSADLLDVGNQRHAHGGIGTRTQIRMRDELVLRASSATAAMNSCVSSTVSRPTISARRHSCTMLNW